MLSMYWIDEVHDEDVVQWGTMMVMRVTLEMVAFESRVV